MKTNAIANVVLASCAILLAGCGPNNAAALRHKGPTRQFEFQVEKNYLVVYRRLLEQARACLQDNLITAQIVAQGDLFPETKSGTVTVAMHAAYGIDTYEVFDVAAVDEDTSKVTAHYWLGNVDHAGRRLKAWVIDNATSCDAQSR
jgi:hypothetical protein